jgi:hypothetical protein
VKKISIVEDDRSIATAYHGYSEGGRQLFSKTRSSRDAYPHTLCSNTEREQARSRFAAANDHEINAEKVWARKSPFGYR